MGNAYHALGDTRKAVSFYQQHLEITRELSDRRGRSQCSNLGVAYGDLRDRRKAISFFKQALALARKIGDRSSEARICWNLGLALEQQGDLAGATELIDICVDYLHELGHPDAKKCAARLDRLRQRLDAESNTAPDDQHDG